MSRSTLRAKARLLLSIARHLRFAERSSDTISLPEIERAATRWSSHNRPSIKTGRGEFSKQYFITEASRWLTFLNRLHLASESVTAFDGMVAEFRNFMVEDRGLSSSTVEFRCKSVRPFLNRLLDRERSLEALRVSDIDALLAEKVNEEHYARISIRGYASSLRAFFRYAESRGWCRRGIAASIMAPRVFQHETLPSGPSWEVVQDILEATAGDHPTTISITRCCCYSLFTAFAQKRSLACNSPTLTGSKTEYSSHVRRELDDMNFRYFRRSELQSSVTSKKHGRSPLTGRFF
jgi:hypothetical protein